MSPKDFTAIGRWFFRSVVGYFLGKWSVVPGWWSVVGGWSMGGGFVLRRKTWGRRDHLGSDICNISMSIVIRNKQKGDE